MRITFLLPVDNLTGGTRVIATYASILQARGHHVQVVSGAHRRPGLREGLRDIRHRRFSALRQRLWPLPGHMAGAGVPHRVLERVRPIVAGDLPDADVVVATWWETAVWMDRLPASKGRKVHLIQGYEVWGGAHTHAAVHAALRLPNRKIAISRTLKDEIEGVLGKLDMSVVPNGVDLSRFNAPPRERGRRPTVGFIYAANSPFKGVDRAIAAIALARETLPELQVLAFGANPPTGALPLPPGCEFHLRPPQAGIAALYAACDAWLFPSRIDSFGLPILEAMACRTPVIGVPVGAAPDLLGEGAGVLLEEADEDVLVRRMADAIVSVSTAPAEVWRQLSGRARRRAEEWGWERAADQLLELIAA